LDSAVPTWQASHLLLGHFVWSETSKTEATRGHSRGLGKWGSGFGTGGKGRKGFPVLVSNLAKKKKNKGCFPGKRRSD